MKLSKHIYTLTFSVLICFSCEDRLEEQIYSELSPSTLFTTEQGLTTVLNASYAYAHRSGVTESWSYYYLNSMPAGETWGEGGSIESLWKQLIDFTWDSNHGEIEPVWDVYFNSIRDANIVLDNVDNSNFSNNYKRVTEAEAHFLRGWAYSELYKLFGGLPLYTSSTDDPLQARVSEAETRAFIEQELLASLEGLPETPEAFGKASQGVALGVLCKYYLNTKQWQQAAEMAQRVIDLGQYTLLPDYQNVFAIENEGNQELIWALPKDGASTTAAQSMNALIFPRDYPKGYDNNTVFAAATYLFDDLVNAFEESDSRLNSIITEYVSTTTGELVVGLGNDMSFPYKLPWDPNSSTFFYGNDISVIRYSDILLSRAEALNELNGPSQEAIDLINQVRARAGASLYTLAGFTQESLRDAIFEERELEFYFEGMAREDQIRQGVFISRAQARGKNAQDFHRLFPIPQVELDANALLEQNPGY